MITPDGTAMPCHGAAAIPHLSFENAATMPLADIWYRSAAFEAYRGTSWMKEPCRTCERCDIDFGGCRCQAMMLAGDAAATDPACPLSPLHDRILRSAEDEAADSAARFRYRRIGALTELA